MKSVEANQKKKKEKRKKKAKNSASILGSFWKRDKDFCLAIWNLILPHLVGKFAPLWCMAASATLVVCRAGPPQAYSCSHGQ